MKDLLSIRLKDLGIIRASGADLRPFLQGQLSADIGRLTPTAAQISSYNSPKGRMLAVLTLIDAGDGSILIELPADLVETTLKRLKMFVLRAKADLDDVSGTHGSIGLIGSAAAAALDQAGLPAPLNPMDSAATADGIIVLRHHGAAPRFSITAPLDTLAIVEARLSALAEPGAFEDWRRSEIRAGLPMVYSATREHFVPQMANLDLFGGISFDKGCYTGQEIVARLHYLGQLKRRLYVCRITGSEVPAAGSEIHTADRDAVAGEIVDAVRDGDEGALATAVLQIEAAKAGALRTPSGEHVEILSAPADSATEA